jgi:hypothetical protein
MFWNGLFSSTRGKVWLLLVTPPLLGVTAAGIRSLTDPLLHTHLTASLGTNRLLPLHHTRLLNIWYDKDRTENTASDSSYVLAFVFVSLGMCLMIRCVATAISSGSTNPDFMRLGGHRHTASKVPSQASFRLFVNEESRLRTHVTEEALVTLDGLPNSVLLMLLRFRLPASVV